MAESPVVMLFPMLVLGVAAVVAGYWANPQWERAFGIPGQWISEFLLTGLEHAAPGLAGVVEVHDFSWWLAGVSTAGALVGILTSVLVYLRWREDRRRDPLEAAGPVYTLLSQKYYLDALYEDTLVRRTFYRRLALALDWLDRNIVDGTVDALGWIFRNTGPVISRLQTGEVQAYGVALTLGSLLIILGFLLS